MNRVTIIGYVGGAPEKRGASNIVSFSLSDKEKGYTKKTTGEVVEDRIQWHRVACFDTKLAEFVSKHIKKGSLVCVDGKIRYGSYVDSEGVTRQSVDIVASSVEFLYLGERREGATEEQ